MTEHEKYLERYRKAKLLMQEKGISFAEAAKIVEGGKEDPKPKGFFAKLFDRWKAR